MITLLIMYAEHTNAYFERKRLSSLNLQAVFYPFPISDWENLVKITLMCFTE